MPSYRFHIDSDDVGVTELPDDIAARAMARETFGMMIREGSIEAEGALEVVDASGRRILMLKFSAE
jgi:hypothetical protein